MHYSLSSCGVGLVCSTKGIKSNQIVRWGIEAVSNLTHRGGVGADGKTGDGAGILIQIPEKFFMHEAERLGKKIAREDTLAVGVFFLYNDRTREIEETVAKYKLTVVGWRNVPIDEGAIGPLGLKVKPALRHLIIDTGTLKPPQRERTLYLARRDIEKRYGNDVYVASLSSQVIVYKGMIIANCLDKFYLDLQHDEIESAFCVFHQRFSTNTLPDWRSAQPLRVLAHNGEINTVQGNRNWMASLEHELMQPWFRGREALISPLISFEESDSASLDHIAELLMLSGASPEYAAMLCIPPIWESMELPEKERAFFEYHSLLMKPWDGPAAVVFTNGEIIGAHLDRNGLRPLRFSITEDDILVLGSETGMIDFNNRKIKERGRLGPGDIFSVDLQKGILKRTPEVMDELSSTRPYGEWLRHNLQQVSQETISAEPLPELRQRQIAFGYSSEEIQIKIKEMADEGRELVFSMGDDTPIPPLSDKPQLLFEYFTQRFAQVTNPPIDPIREKMSMSLRMNLGYKRSFLEQTPAHASRLHLDSPLLSKDDMEAIERQSLLIVRKVMTTAPRGQDPQKALGALQQRTLAAVQEGAEIIILSDRDISKDRIAVPSLLALSTCMMHLQTNNLANKVSFIIETGEARAVHHLACLIGYGASAVYPYLAFETINDLCERKEIPRSVEDALKNYRHAIEKGLLKVLARMGISTLNSYHGAQLFDSLFLTREFVDAYFKGTTVSIEADGLDEIMASVFMRHAAGFDAQEPQLDFGGDLRHRKGGEWHAWSTTAVVALNKFTRSGDYTEYKEFVKVAEERPVYIRHLLTYRKGDPLSLDHVESEEQILKRFFSGAMSIGALSPEAHETIAEACNRLGIRSNSGEGGEDPQRYWGPKNSAIKQIASGRFGVTPDYLSSASELEIKIAQGAKPGEGGYLPSNKVTPYIARLRHCNTNTLLISPPPHHDIYSIEDLAQLIADLKQANPKVKVCVKLVSEVGVGTVAAGVAKAYADIVQISGCEGGTGASYIGSIKHAGNYWEIGLSEAQRVLIENGLRSRVTLRVDGGLRTGRDVIIAALLGAEEFGFGTATMIAEGCVMARQCHLNMCPTGIATQDEERRKKFKGTPERIIAYFSAVAREVKEILAEMGYATMGEIIGRPELLAAREFDECPGAKRVNLTPLIYSSSAATPRKSERARNDNPSRSMNDALVQELLSSIEHQTPVVKEYEIRNTDTSIPAKLNHYISLRTKGAGLPSDTLQLTFRGTAGQSFGAFNHKGLSLTLIGDANDYAGKGMFGGRIAIRPQESVNSHAHVIVGNTVLYGATGGEFFGAGRAGERFCIRNSGATAVIEGAGHHLCEYMTGGVVVVLGRAGYNIGAGMTGGVLYIFDEYNELGIRMSKGYCAPCAVGQEDQTILRSLIEQHYRCTGSQKGRLILDTFPAASPLFKKIVPIKDFESAHY